MHVAWCRYRSLGSSLLCCELCSASVRSTNDFHEQSLDFAVALLSMAPCTPRLRQRASTDVTLLPVACTISGCSRWTPSRARLFNSLCCSACPSEAHAANAVEPFSKVMAAEGAALLLSKPESPMFVYCSRQSPKTLNFEAREKHQL